MRHGISEARVNGCDNPSRALTQRGRERTQAVVTRLSSLGIRADRMFSSPYARALETAWLAHRGGLAPEPECAAELMPAGDHHALLPFSEPRVLLVGHEPDLGDFAADLIGASPGTLCLRKAGLIHLKLPAHHRGPWRGVAQLEGLIKPGMMLLT